MVNGLAFLHRTHSNDRGGWQGVCEPVIFRKSANRRTWGQVTLAPFECTSPLR